MTGAAQIVFFSVAGLTAAACTAGPAVVPANARDTLTTAPLRCVTTFVVHDASTQPGEPIPLAAARWFTASGTVADLPKTAWLVSGSAEGRVILRSGDVVLHAFTGRDGTWRVGSGQRCRYPSP